MDPSGGARRSHQAETQEVVADAATTIHQAGDGTEVVLLVGYPKWKVEK